MRIDWLIFGEWAHLWEPQPARAGSRLSCSRSAFSALASLTYGYWLRHHPIPVRILYGHFRALARRRESGHRAMRQRGFRFLSRCRLSPSSTSGRRLASGSGHGFSRILMWPAAILYPYSTNTNSVNLQLSFGPVCGRILTYACPTLSRSRHFWIKIKELSGGSGVEGDIFLVVFSEAWRFSAVTSSRALFYFYSINCNFTFFRKTHLALSRSCESNRYRAPSPFLPFLHLGLHSKKILGRRQENAQVRNGKMQFSCFRPTFDPIWANFCLKQVKSSILDQKLI